MLVHKPIDIKHVKHIPDAKAALDKEWKKMRDKRAWLVETVQDKHKVMEKARHNQSKVHFGSLMQLAI